MDTKHEKTDKVDTEERKQELRNAINSADATGLVAGEELITQAETILPTTERAAPRRET